MTNDPSMVRSSNSNGATTTAGTCTDDVARTQQLQVVLTAATTSDQAYDIYAHSVTYICVPCYVTVRYDAGKHYTAIFCMNKR